MCWRRTIPHHLIQARNRFEEDSIGGIKEKK